MPYGQEQQFNPQLMEAMQAQEQLRFQQQAAQQLGDPSGAAGGLGMLASALGGLMQGRNRRKLSEGQANIDQQLAQHQAQVQQQLAQQAQAKQTAKYAREDLIWNRENEAKIEAATAGRRGTPLMQNVAAQGLQQGSPEYQQAIQEGMKKTGQTINVGGDKVQSEFEKSYAKENVKSLVGWRDDAMLAQQSQNSLDQLQPLLQAMDTGQVQQVMAMGSKLFGGKRAQDFESVRGIAGDLVMTELNKMKGSAQLAERQYIESLLADYGKTPEANQNIIKYLSGKNKMIIDRFNSADQHRKEFGNLQDYTPSFSNKVFNNTQEKQKSTPQAVQGGDLSGLSMDELLKMQAQASQ